MTQHRLIIEILPNPGSPSRRFVAAEAFPFVIGRGFGSDLILEDPYVSPAHLRIDWASDRGWTVTDERSENGFFVNGLDLSGRSASLSSGDEITVGRTRLRVFSPAHSVARTLPLPRGHGTMAVLAKPLNALIFFFIAIMAATLWTWLEVWTSDSGLTVTMLVLATALVMIIWSGVWAMAGRIIRHRAGFFDQLTLTSVFMLLSAAGYYMIGYVDFLNNEGKISLILECAVNFALTAGLLSGALGIASDMPARKRRLTSCLFAAGLVLGSLGISIIGTRSFSPEPEYPWGLKPYLSSWASAETADGFISSSDKIFDSAALKIKKKKGAAD